jgi:transcriptional regulator with XRE-family HTH domain/DNA polymerase III delta prime subunit
MPRNIPSEKGPNSPNNLLQQAREARGWSQKQLAVQLSVGETTIRSWESGRRTPGRALQDQLCQIFGTTPEFLGLLPPSLAPVEEGETTRLQDARSHVSEEVMEPQLASTVVTSSSSVNKTQGERSSLQRRGDKNRIRMLQRVQRTWIDGVLQRSLHHAALLDLDLLEMPDALENPWHLAVQETNGSTHLLPSGTSIVQVYDFAEGELLLLGEPGAGKTTLLLELTRELLRRAEQNERYPIPVVFNLTSWPMRQATLTEWLIEELRAKYQVPKKVGQGWVEENRLIVLLDGLDETAEEVRSACVKAIGAYQQEQPLVSLVICCRKEEYFAQTTRIVLREAVLIQPLTHKQIDLYLASAGSQLETVRQALLDDHLLLEMITNPLMLSVVTLAYRGEIASLARTGSIESRRRQVFETYTRRMLERRGVDTRYSTEETIRWLTWLAKQMQRQSLTEFYLERIQPGWLANNQIRERYRHKVVRIVNGMECFIVAGLFALLRGGEIRGVVGVGVGLLGWLGSGPGNTVLGWMAPGLGGGLGGGGSLGIIIAFVTILVTLLVGTQFPTLTWRSACRGMLRGGRIGLTIGMIVGVLSGILFALNGGVANGAFRGLGAGLFSGLLTGLESGLITGLRPALEPPPHTSRATKKRKSPLPPSSFSLKWSRRAVDRLFDFISFSWCAGVGFGGTYALLIGGITENVFIYGSIVALFFCLLFSLGDGTSLIQGLGETITPAETATWSWISARQALGATLSKGFQVGLIVTISVMMILGCASGLFYGATYGVHYALVYGPIVGLVGASAGILTGILNNGWSSTTLAEHLLVHPNEGMRRTLKNALFATCLFGPLGGLVSGLVSGLAFWWVGGLAGWTILGIGFAIVFGAIFSLQFVTTYGGIAWIEHYLLRWYFWRTGGLPAKCVPFLDYAAERILLRKIGGGYMFSHRLLLDYFASLDPSHISKPNNDDASNRHIPTSSNTQSLKAQKP